MNNSENLSKLNPFDFKKNSKNIFFKLIKDLTLHHTKNSREYKKLFEFSNLKIHLL